MRSQHSIRVSQDSSAEHRDAFAQSTLIREKLEDLRTQLADLAFELERRGQPEAADVAIATSSRIAELCKEAGFSEGCTLALRR